jgi:hypothetical protein
MKASRSRVSLSFSRRVLKNQPCVPEAYCRGWCRADAPVTDRRKVVARRPDARGEFLPEQITFGGEPLEGNFAVAVKFVAHDVEIVVSTRDRQIGAPPILDPVVLDEAAGVEAPDLVGKLAGTSHRNVCIDLLPLICKSPRDSNAKSSRRTKARDRRDQGWQAQEPRRRVAGIRDRSARVFSRAGGNA